MQFFSHTLQEFDISKFQKIKKINEGGCGIVYKVKEIETNDIYAAKVMKDNNIDEEYKKKMIDREIILLSSINHPTINKIIGFSSRDFKNKENITIIMKLAENGSLADVIKKIQSGLGPPYYTNTSRQIILTGIARGMKYLHDRNIIHRDLKPGNILLDENFYPYITDFGLSKYFQTGQTDIQTQNMGTPIYTAPEAIKNTNYNTKADVYSFGILMFEVLTDQFPFPELIKKKMTIYDFQTKVVNNNYRPKFTIPVPKPLKELAEKCWAADPNERPTFTEIFNKLSMKNESDGNNYLLPDVSIEEFKSYIADITEVTDNVDKLNNEIEKIEKEKNQLKILNKRLQTQNDQLKEDKDQLQIENDQLKEEKNQLQIENDQLKEEKNQLLIENGQINEDKGQLNKDKNQSHIENGQLKEDKDQPPKNANELNKSTENYETKNNQFQPLSTFFATYKIPILCLGLFIEIFFLLTYNLTLMQNKFITLLIFIAEFVVCCLKNKFNKNILYTISTIILTSILNMLLDCKHKNDFNSILELIYLAFFNIMMHLYFIPKVSAIKYYVFASFLLLFDFIIFLFNWEQFIKIDDSPFFIITLGTLAIYLITIHYSLSINFIHFIYLCVFLLFHTPTFEEERKLSKNLQISFVIIMILLIFQYGYTILMKKDFLLYTFCSIFEMILLLYNYYSELINIDMFHVFCVGYLINYFLILKHPYSALLFVIIALVAINYQIYNIRDKNLRTNLFFIAFSGTIKLCVLMGQFIDNHFDFIN